MEYVWLYFLEYRKKNHAWNTRYESKSNGRCFLLIHNVSRVAQFQAILFLTCKNHGSSLEGTAPLDLISKTVHFLKKLRNFGQSIHPMDPIRNIPRNSKIIVLFQWSPCLWSKCKQCVKINIFHVLIHKSVTSWVCEISVQ